jgi:hypothetical protein
MDDLKTNGNKTNKNYIYKSKYFLVFLLILVASILFLVKLKSSPERVLWSEGIATAGNIARELKDYASATGSNGHYPPTWKDLDNFFAAQNPNVKIKSLVSDNEGNFRKEHFRWEANYEPNLDPPIEFKIIITRPEGCSKPDAIMLNNKSESFNLDENGKWVHW